MGITKSTLFSESINQIANVCKALGHPARMAIIEHLLTHKNCICGDIVEELPLAQATISQHLKALKEAKIIKGNIEGNSICYCLNEETLGHLKGYFQELIGKIDCQNTSCCTE